MSASSPGEKRRRKAKREREQAAYAAACADLRLTGACCSTCAHYGNSECGRHCELDSDFKGYILRDPQDVCPRHQPR